MSITLSTARSIAIPASPGNAKPSQVAAMMTSVARGTPATPFDVSISVSIIVTCDAIESSIFAACAMVSVASTR